jgi:hypothetical protein
MKHRLPQLALGLVVLASFVASTTQTSAEPVYALRTGHSCATCHISQGGGGVRTAFGNLYSQLTLPQRLGVWRDGKNLLPANPDARFVAGADLRVQYEQLQADGDTLNSSFGLVESNFYLRTQLIPGRFDLYLDETVGPSGASTRELYGQFSFGNRLRSTIKAGKFLPSFGWRLPNDHSFVRQATGFSFDAPDTGIEYGLAIGRADLIFAVVNGAGGNDDTNKDKKLVGQMVHRFKRWRIGASASTVTVDDVTSEMTGVQAGIHSGRLSFLGELDVIKVRREEGTDQQLVAYFEGNLLIRRGLNLKYVHDWINPERTIETNERTRDSLGIEYCPIPFVQLRAFVRTMDGPPQLPGTQDDQLEFQLHVFF